MPLDPVMLRIQRWAASGDRTDPEDASLTPPLDETLGWPASFSAADGDTPRRAVMNEIFYRLTVAARELLERGIYEWDAGVNYRRHAIVQAGGSTWRATVATGPATSNAQNPVASGQTIWASASSALGTAAVPDAPNTPTATTSSRQLDWRWNCPRDNGAVVSAFHFQSRQQGQAWPSDFVTIQPSSAFYSLSGLTNGTTYEVRVRAVNSEGNGPWSATGSAAPQASVPGQVIGLTATGFDEEVRLTFPAPDDGGDPILAYQIQWRSSAEAFASSRQREVTGSPAVISGLTNGTTYFFRVRARNVDGAGIWSDVASATPSPADFETTTSTTFTWPWDTNRGFAVITAGGGGGGGGGGGATGPSSGGSGPRPPDGFGGSAGSSGRDGGSTIVAYGSNTYAADNGEGGSSGGGGTAGTAEDAGSESGVQFFSVISGANGTSGGTRTASGNGGDGGAGGGGIGSGGNGGNGEGGTGGEVLEQTITGLAIGTVLTITIGAGGAGGAGGSGAGGDGGNGQSGGGGNVRIVPLY